MKPKNFPGRVERRRARARTHSTRDYWPKDIRIRMGRAAHDELLRTKGGWS